MSQLTFTGFAAAINSATHSRITNLIAHDQGGGMHLYSTTRYDGVLQQWDLSNGSVTIGDNITFDGPLQAGGIGELGTLTVGGGAALLTAGGSGGDLQIILLNGTGGFASQTALPQLPNAFAGLQHSTTIALGTGDQTVFGAIAGSTGIASLRFNDQGVLQDHAILQDPTAQTAAQISGLAQIDVAGQTYLLTISPVHNGLTSRAVSANGDLTFAGFIDADDGLWIDAPTALATTTLNGNAYAVIASANSDSLSVVEIGADGTMTVRDHILDTRDTRFGGVVALEIQEHAGRTYVIAGGADDGISVFLLLQGGLLVHRASIVDTVNVSLDNVSAVAGRSGQTGLEIFIASSSEAGVTKLRYDTGTAGITATATLAGGLLAGGAGEDVLQGHNGNDIIHAAGGDDILRDGFGQDTMTGGAGRDVFIMTADGSLDTITDFTIGEDQIDLSLWSMLRSSSQLTMTLRTDGMEITYGDETLIVQNADGGPIDYRDLPSSDLIGASRLPINLTPGYPGPPTPVDIDPPAGPTDAQGGPYDPVTPLTLITRSNMDILRDQFGSPTTGFDGDVDNGGTAAEVFSGSDYFDLIFAGAVMTLSMQGAETTRFSGAVAMIHFWVVTAQTRFGAARAGTGLRAGLAMTCLMVARGPIRLFSTAVPM
jgi:serralysin